MIREIITPKRRSMTIRIPQRMVGKPLELTIVEQDTASVQTSESAELEQAVKFFTELSADFTNYRFDRDEANER